MVPQVLTVTLSFESFPKGTLSSSKLGSFRR